MVTYKGKPEDQVEFFKDALRDEGARKGQWVNLSSNDEAEWIREGGMLYVKMGESSVEVLLNTDLKSAVGGKTYKRMKEDEGGRYRIHQINLFYEDLVDWFDSEADMKEALTSEGYPEPSDVIVDLGRRHQDGFNMENTDNFWEYMESEYGITAP